MESIVQPKGQVTLPKRAREELGIKPGDKIIWIRNSQSHWEVWTLNQLVEDLASSLDGLPAFLGQAKKAFNRKSD